jgi:uncharacterized protein
MTNPYNTAPENYQPTQNYPFPVPNVGEGRFVMRKHNHYNSEDFLKFAVQKGTIHTRSGLRAFLATEDFVVGLHRGLEEEVGDAAAMILYRCGFRWGVEDMKVFVPIMEEEFNLKRDDMEVNFLLETWWWWFQTQGWGAWKLDLSQRKQGMIFVDVFDSAIAKSLGNVGKPTCYLYAGVMAGVLTYLAKRDLAGIEVQCYAMGEDFCKFLIGAEKRINAAQFWLTEGATATEIIQRL